MFLVFVSMFLCLFLVFILFFNPFLANGLILYPWKHEKTQGL